MKAWIPDSDSLEDLYRMFPHSTYPGLERIQAFLKCLDYPEKKLPPVAHIAGTNGKGSTQAFMKSLCESFGKAVHCYTSPHLIRPHERIVLRGAPISSQSFNDLLQETIPVGQSIPGLSWFEFLTGAAFLAFSRTPADLVILETGLGGRLDATNVCKKPAVTLITPISYDHQHFLGNRLESIAFEKAGILKSGVPVFSASQAPEALKVLQQQAREKTCPFFLERPNQDVVKGAGWFVQEVQNGFSFQDENNSFHLPRPGLVGSHQIQNAGLALKAFLHLYPDCCEAYTLSQAMRTVSWPGRLQRLKHHPLLQGLPEGTQVWVDGAHNPAGAKALRQVIDEWDQPLVLILSLLKNKNPEDFLENLIKPEDQVILIPTPNPEKGHDPKELALLVKQLKGRPLVAESTESALRMFSIKERILPRRYLICGSLMLVGEILQDEIITP